MGGVGRLLMVLAALAFVAMMSTGWLLFSKAAEARAEAELAEAEAALADRAERRAALSEVEIADFALIDQRGDVVTDEALDGQYTIVSFMFSYCTLACPALTGNLFRVNTEGPAHVRLLSISVDPVNDTPERLAAHAEGYTAVPPKWRMVTGPEETVRDVAQSLGFDFRTDPGTLIDMGGGETMANIVHPLRFVLFGPDRKIIDTYLGTEEDEIERLLLDLRALPVPGAG